MNLRAGATKFIAGVMLERPARRQGLAAQVAGLEAGGQALTDRLHRATGTSKDREVLRHIIGIERWGVHRLELLTKGALSNEAITDSHRRYKPASDDWAALIADFVKTREETLELARSFSEDQGTLEVAHNSIGSLSVRAWLRYLKQHATFEGSKIKPR